MVEVQPKTRTIGQGMLKMSVSVNVLTQQEQTNSDVFNLLGYNHMLQSRFTNHPRCKCRIILPINCRTKHSI